ncbi:MAG: aryl-sulfate sulfotransferase, partial [Desulfovibrionaceae bacterium]|nr:aryl-sulfate sulfotransferase [Desulfovibrionaceae bacterium]
MDTRVKHTYEDFLITRQNRAEKEFMAAFEKASPSLADATVLVNPYFINPLCALILFKTEQPAVPTLTVHGKRNERESISHTFAEGTSHVLPVVGLYEGIKTRVTVALSTGESQDFMIEAQPLPADVCRCRNVNTSIQYFGTDFMFLTPAGKNLPTAYDYAGDIRWMLTENTMFAIKRYKNGNIVTGSMRFCHMPYNSTGIVEMNLLGKVYKEYRMPGNYHHDHFEMPDGNILVLTQDFHTSTVEDMMVLLDRETGEILKTWDYKDILPQDVAGSGSQDAHDWFHNNALWYNEKDNTVTLSGRHQDAVINIDYETGKLNWIIGDPEGWPEDMQKYFFKPVGDLSKFDWQYEQHACVVCPDGDIMCFDNGHWRSKNKEKYLRNRDNFSRGVRYRIDTDKMEIEQVWQYGKELGESFFSPYICNVEYYAEGHYLIHSGGIAWKDGYASDKLGAWINPETMPEYDICSKTVEEKDGVVMYYLEVDGNYYRGTRLTAYHDGDNAPLGEGKLIGHLDVTPTFDTIPDVPESDQVIDSWHMINIEEDEDRIVFHGRFARGSLAMVLFEGDKETRAYYLNTAASNYKAM